MFENIVPLIRPGNGCDYHRIMQPLKYMGFDMDAYKKLHKRDTFNGNEILFFNRYPIDPVEKVIELKKKHGFKIVVDLDDYWELNVNHLIYSAWKKNKISERIIESLKNSDAVIVTTSLLADKIKEYSKNIYVVPNALPFNHENFNTEKNPSDNLRFMWAGGSTHFWDLQLLKIPFTKINNERPTNVQFLMGGYNHDSSVFWDKMERSFSLVGKLQGYVRKETLPLESYIDIYKDSDVSLVPLESNLFTPYKSNLKIIEAGCKNVPVICSDSPPYSNEPNRNVIMYAKNTREWYEQIKYCIKNRSFVEDKGKELGEYVREHYDLIKVNELRKQIFENL